MVQSACIPTAAQALVGLAAVQNCPPSSRRELANECEIVHQLIVKLVGDQTDGDDVGSSGLPLWLILKMVRPSSRLMSGHGVDLGHSSGLLDGL